MARGGLYRTDIEKARASLLAQGKHPSVDAVRVALGNTGSKTTIHRYLKEIEAEEGHVGARVPLTEALQDLVGRLAAQLKTDADALVAEAKARCEAQLREKDDILAQKARHIADLDGRLQQTQAELANERDALASAQATVQARDVSLAQLNERRRGLEQRLADHETQIASLETKHQQAREALEHFRTAAKEQRETEARRHEQQVQSLQVELRHATEAIAAKNHELRQLSGDAGRLTEQVGHLQKDLREAQQAGQSQLRELEELRPLPQQLRDHQTRWQGQLRELEAVQGQVRALTEERDREQALRQAAQTDLARVQARAEVLEDVVTRLRVVPAGPTEEPKRKRSASSEPQPGLALDPTPMIPATNGDRQPDDSTKP